MHDSIAHHFVENQKSLGNLGLGGSLTHQHTKALAEKIKPHVDDLLNHINNMGGSAAGGIISGGSAAGGRLSGGVFLPNILNPKQAYHHALTLKPHQFEMHREIAAQILGAHPSPMWGKLVDKSDKMEAKPEDYENVVRMPNTHAAAKMIEAENGSGGGFWKAFRHSGRIAHKVYKLGHKAVEWAGNNRDLINAFLPAQYKDTANNWIDIFSKVDKIVNPLVDSAIKISGTSVSPAQKIALAKQARESVQNTLSQEMSNGKLGPRPTLNVQQVRPKVHRPTGPISVIKQPSKVVSPQLEETAGEFR